MEEIESPGKRKRKASEDDLDDEHVRKRQSLNITDASRNIDDAEEGEIIEDDQINDQAVSDDDCQIIDQSITIVNLDTTLENADDEDDDENDEKEETIINQKDPEVDTDEIDKSINSPIIPSDLIEIDTYAATSSPTPLVEKDKSLTSPQIPSDLIEIDSYVATSSPTLVRECLFTINFNCSNIFNEFKTEIRQSLKSLFRRMNKSIEISEKDLQLEICESIDDGGDVGSCHESSSDSDLFGNLFTIDASPNELASNHRNTVVPQYSVNATKVFNHEKDVYINEDDICKRPTKPKNHCFNCDGTHTIRDCPEPKNFAKIRENRKSYGSSRVERYHVNAEQRFGQFLPGVISENLRKALGYRSRELPIHIYRMRELGYPPGWLENAKISKSGLTLFDSKGKTIGLDTEEAGEIPEEVEYDLKKIISFPGFNVSPPSGTIDESCDYRTIPMQPHQSKKELIKVLQANSTKSYKRKKLSNLPVTDDLDNNNGDVILKESITVPENIELTTEEMDIDSSDDIPVMPVGVPTNLSAPPLPIEPPNDSSRNRTPPPPPPPPPDSPTLIDLRKQKELLLAALDCSSLSTTTFDSSTVCEGDSTANDSLIDDILSLDRTRVIDEEIDVSSASITLTESSVSDSIITQEDSVSNVTPTTLNKSKHHVFCTPLIESASSFSVLPTGTKWSEGVTDVIDFENLPESTGKYVQMKSVIEKVRNVVKKLNQEYEKEG